MIICFDKKTNELKSIISGNNPISPYYDEIVSIDIPEQQFMAKKGDKVYVDRKSNTIKVGSHMLKMCSSNYTEITLENYMEPIILEEL